MLWLIKQWAWHATPLQSGPSVQSSPSPELALSAAEGGAACPEFNPNAKGVFFGVLLIVFPLGFGFDPFIHEATEKLILAGGTRIFGSCFEIKQIK